MQVILMEATPNAEKVVSRAAKQCYDAGYVGDTYAEEKGLLVKADIDRIRKVLSMGHTSVLEHANYTFAIKGISRACSHQLVRFRHASYSQQSQRYCVVKDDYSFVIPPTISANCFMEKKFKHLMAYLGKHYQEFIDAGIPAEDARFLLPNACETNIVVTMNARELHHAFNLRCCTHAQWEIRDMFNRMKDIVKEINPLLFENVGAPCDVNGTCPEGARSCGKV